MTYETRALMHNRRTASFSRMVDPGDENREALIFQRTVFDRIFTRAQVRLMSGDEIVKKGHEWGDFNGFGRGFTDRDVKDHMTSYPKKYPDLNTIVNVTIQSDICTSGQEDKSIFYDQSIKYLPIPASWDWVNGTPNSHILEDYVIWKNGEFTPTFKLYCQRCIDLLEKDVSDDHRKQKHQPWSDIKTGLIAKFREVL